MTTRQKIAFSVCVAAALAVGYIAGVRVTQNSASEMIEALNLSKSALDTTRFTVLLKAHRDGKADLAAERMETMLDFAILGIARDYTPSRDVYQSAEKALREAADYRAAHPYHNPVDPVGAQVREALSRPLGGSR